MSAETDVDPSILAMFDAYRAVLCPTCSAKQDEPCVVTTGVHMSRAAAYYRSVGKA